MAFEHDDPVSRARDGDQVAYARLVDRYFGSLFALAVRIVRDRDLADDCTQETFVAAWRDLRGLRDPAAFPAWIRRILVRTCYRQLGDTGRSDGRIRSIDVHVEAALATPDPTDALLRRDQLERAFRRLRPEHRAVVVFYHYDRMTLAAIADLLSIPAGTVASRLHYAHSILRAALDADARTGVGDLSR